MPVELIVGVVQHHLLPVVGYLVGTMAVLWVARFGARIFARLAFGVVQTILARALRFWRILVGWMRGVITVAHCRIILILEMLRVHGQ
jgi:hypothetical protein